MSVEDNKYLRTDAVPDEPRKNVPNANNPETNHVNEKDNEIIDNITSENEEKQWENIKKTSSKPKHKTHRNTKSSQTFTKVINILNSNGVHIGAVNNYNVNSNDTNKQQEQQRTTERKKNIARTKMIDQMFTNENAVIREHINFVADHLGDGWRNVGENLGYSDGQMDHFWADHKNIGHKEVVYQMLLDWIQLKPDTSKVCDLAKALWDANENNVVSRWAKHV